MDKYTLCVDNWSLLGITLPFSGNYSMEKRPPIHMILMVSPIFEYISQNQDSIQNYPQMVVGKPSISDFHVITHIWEVKVNYPPYIPIKTMLIFNDPAYLVFSTYPQALLRLLKISLNTYWG